MQQVQQTTMRETRLAGWGRTLQLLLDAGFAALIAAAIIWSPPAFLASPVVWAVLGLMIVVAVYNPVSRFRTGLVWNEEGIRHKGIWRNGPLCRWQDLTEIRRNSHKRAAILHFGMIRRVTVRWSFDAYREIADLAERKLKENA